MGFGVLMLMTRQKTRISRQRAVNGDDTIRYYATDSRVNTKKSPLLPGGAERGQKPVPGRNIDSDRISDSINCLYFLYQFQHLHLAVTGSFEAHTCCRGGWSSRFQHYPNIQYKNR